MGDSIKTTGRSSGNVTLGDVARLARVSAMTVSRVINNEPNVLQSTRTRVQKAIKQLRYSPNNAARSLASGKAARIGLLYSNPSETYLSQFLVGALARARATDSLLIIEECDPDDAHVQQKAIARLLDAGVRGVMLPPPLSECDPILDQLDNTGVPAVTVAMGRRHPNRLNVRIDDFAAAKQMTQHLIELGHSRIGFIRGDVRQIASHEREHGFQAAITESGLSRAGVVTEQGDFTFPGGLKAGAALLDRDKALTAIFASNDDMAAGVVSVAHQRGLEIPNDLSVAGFDDTGVATLTWPQLTTVRQPVSAMADTAIQLILQSVQERKLNEDQRAIDRVLPHELVVRGSTGPAPAMRLVGRSDTAARG